MSTMKQLDELPATEVWDGIVARRIDGDRMTLSIVEIPAGRHVPEHQHDNEQIGFVIRGSITFTIGDEKRTLGPGGSWNIPSGVPHSCDVGPEGVSRRRSIRTWAILLGAAARAGVADAVGLAT